MDKKDINKREQLNLDFNAEAKPPVDEQQPTATIVNLFSEKTYTQQRTQKSPALSRLLREAEKIGW